MPACYVEMSVGQQNACLLHPGSPCSEAILLILFSLLIKREALLMTAACTHA